MGCDESTQAGAVPTWGSVGCRWTCLCPLSSHDQRRLFHLPPPAPCHPILMHQGCMEHQATPLHLPWEKGWGWEGSCSPLRWLGGWWAHPGLVIHPPFPLCSGMWFTCPPATVLRVGQGRRAECWARRGQDKTRSLMPAT